MSETRGDARYTMGRSKEEEEERLIQQSQLYDAVTRRLLNMAGLGRGMRVLDIGSGTGDVAMTAAEVVGPEGAVVGVDVNPAILETARARAGEAGFENVEFVAGDARTLDLGGDFDALIACGREPPQGGGDEAMVGAARSLVMRDLQPRSRLGGDSDRFLDRLEKARPLVAEMHGQHPCRRGDRVSDVQQFGDGGRSARFVVEAHRCPARTRLDRVFDLLLDLRTHMGLTWVFQSAGPNRPMRSQDRDVDGCRVVMQPGQVVAIAQPAGDSLFGKLARQCCESSGVRHGALTAVPNDGSSDPTCDFERHSRVCRDREVVVRMHVYEARSDAKVRAVDSHRRGRDVGADGDDVLSRDRDVCTERRCARSVVDESTPKHDSGHRSALGFSHLSGHSSKSTMGHPGPAWARRHRPEYER